MHRNSMFSRMKRSGSALRSWAVLSIALLLFTACSAPMIPAETASPSSTEAASTVITTAAPEQTTAAAQTDVVSSTAAPEPVTTEETEAPEPSDNWKLVLVNADHPLPEDFSVTLKQLRNNQQVDERMYPELQQMFDDARSIGIYPYINESFRTRERQQEIMDKYIANYEAQGLNHEDAVKKARSIVALPGTSEHELGLALDIIDERNADSSNLWKWLKDNCWRYGFILRYPADKVEITGIDYEPWHFRYVGVEAAKDIMESGLCLEEYLEQNP